VARNSRPRNRPTLLVEGPEDPDLKRILRRAARDANVLFAATDDDLLRHIVDADAYFGKISPALLAASTRLRWVHSPTIGLEGTIFPELVAHPLVLTHPRGIFSEDIADHVMGFVLCFARGFHLHVRAQVRAYWAAMREHRVIHLPDASMGVVGLGGIGTALAARARAAEMTVFAVDPVRPRPPRTVSRMWRPSQLRRMLDRSDFVVICAPETPETRGLFDSETIAAMRPGSFLINVGRGAIVQLDPLVAALASGHLAGAGLDVFEQEPLPATHPLWAMENVIVTPHMAGLGPHLRSRRTALLADNVARFTSGRKLRGLVDKTRWF